MTTMQYTGVYSQTVYTQCLQKVSYSNQVYMNYYNIPPRDVIATKYRRVAAEKDICSSNTCSPYAWRN